MPRHTLVSTLMRLTMRYGARWSSHPRLGCMVFRADENPEIDVTLKVAPQ